MTASVFLSRLEFFWAFFLWLGTLLRALSHKKRSPEGWPFFVVSGARQKNPSRAKRGKRRRKGEALPSPEGSSAPASRTKENPTLGVGGKHEKKVK
jgi:hypothetical protein